MTNRMEVLPNDETCSTRITSYSAFNNDDDSVSCVVYKMHPTESTTPPNGFTVGINGLEDGLSIKLYKKRFFILTLFCLYSASNAFQWLQYSIITSKISTFYQIDNLTVNLTSMIYMFVFVPGMIPASWFLDHFGLRWSVLL